jgi:hypothetical protein
MSLGNSVFIGRIARLSLFGTDLPLPRDAALELIPDFPCAALFKWISASPYHERARANNRQGPHLFILGNKWSNARAWLKHCRGARRGARRRN